MANPNVYVVRTDLDHLLIFAGKPEYHHRYGWSGKLNDDLRVERFCRIALVKLGWIRQLACNVPAHVVLVNQKGSQLMDLKVQSQRFFL
jgi:hypothetical protein